MAYKILHIAPAEKFLPSYIDFVNEKFESSDHYFLISSGMSKGFDDSRANIFLLTDSLFSKVCYLLNFIWRGIFAEKIILHGLFSGKMIIFFAAQPWLHKKSYWAIWGWDLYDHLSGAGLKWKIGELFKRVVINRLGALITHIGGDYQLARDWYAAKGTWINCFMYPSNLYRNIFIEKKDSGVVNVLLGNSATRSNNHFDALNRLGVFFEENICIYCPLSYGESEYADAVDSYGRDLFGDKFVPLREFMDFADYIELLGKIDIAVFNHDRQQAMGNITTLLGLGKKVYMRNNITSFQALCALGIVVHDIDNISLDEFDPLQASNNKEIIATVFSEENLKKSLAEIFG